MGSSLRGRKNLLTDGEGLDLLRRDSKIDAKMKSSQINTPIGLGLKLKKTRTSLMKGNLS